MDLTWALGSLVLVALAVYLVHRVPKRTGVHVWPAWDVALAPQAPERQRYDEYAADLEDELGAFEATLRKARTDAQQGELAEAARVVVIAAQHAVRHVPTLSRRLELWNDAVHVLSAVYPLPRLRVFAFRQWRLRGAAAGEGLLRTALDAAHRFALRVWVLLFGLRVVLRGFARTSRTVQVDSTTIDRSLRQLEDLGSDLGTLHRASLEVYRAVLISSQAER